MGKIMRNGISYTGGASSSGGGSTGTFDYSELENKPSINGVTLNGNKTSSDLNIDNEVYIGTEAPTNPNVKIWINPDEDLPPKSKGVAVVFGDSFFNNPNVGYEFGDWLEEEQIYDEVINYAHEGTGFGNTYEYVSGYSMYELVQKPEVQTSIAKADVIYIHLGGNDIISTINEYVERKVETQLKTKIEYIFSTIRNLNEKVIVYYIKCMDHKQATFMAASGSNSYGFEIDSYLPIFNTLYTIDSTIANLTTKPLIQVMQGTSSEFINEYASETDFHPSLKSANNMFHHIVYDAAYERVKFNWAFSNGDLSDSGFMSALQDLFTAYSLRTAATSIDVVIAIEGDAKNYYSIFENNTIVGNLLLLNFVQFAGGNGLMSNHADNLKDYKLDIDLLINLADPESISQDSMHLCPEANHQDVIITDATQSAAVWLNVMTRFVTPTTQLTIQPKNQFDNMQYFNAKWKFSFITGATFSLDFDYAETIKWEGNNAPTFNPYTAYEVTIDPILNIASINKGTSMV